VSLYGVDKFLYHLHHDHGAVEQYAAGPAAFVARWESGEGRQLEPGETLADTTLTEAERDALAQRDISALYAMGAHPFMLVGIMRVAHGFQGKDEREWSAYYVERVGRFGRPDVRT